LNHLNFDEHEFPFRKKKMVKPCLSDNATDILLASDPVLKWIVYNKLHVGNTFLYCYMGDDVVYLQTPVWWPEPIP
jgi:hypothetical protein